MNNAIEKILTLTRRREKFLVVAAVRFMRTIISRNVRFMDFEFFSFYVVRKLEAPLKLCPIMVEVFLNVS